MPLAASTTFSTPPRLSKYLRANSIRSKPSRPNVLGTDNVLEAAIINSVSRVVCLSTDKAVYPINRMGLSKALMEKVMIAKSRVGARHEQRHLWHPLWQCSRLSWLRHPSLRGASAAGAPITITDPAMTRFVMTLSEAVGSGSIRFPAWQEWRYFHPKPPAVTIETLASSILEILGKRTTRGPSSATRHGEKLFETLLSREEMAHAANDGSYFRVAADERDLNYGAFVESGEPRVSEFTDYNSHNAHILTAPP